MRQMPQSRALGRRTGRTPGGGPLPKQLTTAVLGRPPRTHTHTHAICHHPINGRNVTTACCCVKTNDGNMQREAAATDGLGRKQIVGCKRPERQATVAPHGQSSNTGRAWQALAEHTIHAFTFTLFCSCQCKAQRHTLARVADRPAVAAYVPLTKCVGSKSRRPLPAHAARMPQPRRLQRRCASH